MLKERLVVTGVASVNVLVVGTYHITYDLTDTQKFSALQVTRIVEVRLNTSANNKEDRCQTLLSGPNLVEIAISFKLCEVDLHDFLDV